MAFLLGLLMALVSCLLGKCALGVLYGNQPARDKRLRDAFLTGGIVVIGLAEAAYLAAVISGWSFSGCVRLFGALTAALTAGAGVYLFLRRGQKKMGHMQRQDRDGGTLWTGFQRLSGFGKAAFFLFWFLLLLQLVSVASQGRVYRQGDMTVETVNSFLETDTIYGVNPLTGQAYELGLPLRLKILCLPAFYACLCRISGLEAATVVWGIVPLFTLFGAYCAFFGIGERLFPESPSKRWIFLAFTALILWGGDYMYGIDGFGLLYSGFRGNVIRAAVLLPYTFDLCMRKMWKSVILCILAEACMVWTLYGMGACLLAALLLFLIQKLPRGAKGLFHREGG